MLRLTNVCHSKLTLALEANYCHSKLTRAFLSDWLLHDAVEHTADSLRCAFVFLGGSICCTVSHVATFVLHLVIFCDNFCVPVVVCSVQLGLSPRVVTEPGPSPTAILLFLFFNV